jgi:hypothetical protein
MAVQNFLKYAASTFGLVMLTGTIVLAPTGLHADDSMWTTGTTIAMGHFRPEDLCKNAAGACRVLGDTVKFRIDHAARHAEGVALAKIA